MAVFRVLPAVLAAVVLYCCTVAVHSQPYLPEPVPFGGCPPGQRLLTLGTTDTSNQTMFPYQGDIFTDVYGYVSVTPITLHDQAAFGVKLYQMALALDDNRFLQQPAHLRLGIYLYQEAEKNVMGFDFAALIAQTDFITVRDTHTNHLTPFQYVPRSL